MLCSAFRNALAIDHLSTLFILCHSKVCLHDSGMWDLATSVVLMVNNLFVYYSSSSIEFSVADRLRLIPVRAIVGCAYDCGYANNFKAINR